MATNHTSKVLQVLRRTALLRDGAGLTDAQLLEEYLRRREEAALAALVRRHGPMVWGVCRRVLHNHHDAEDAFQATFLVLVRKAATIDPPEMVANWLYGVAHQTALKARATAAKRKTRERQVEQMPEPAVNDNNDLWNDLQPLLDQELSRLSDKYRSAIVLCDLEGKTRREAARQLGVPEGTVAARLARGRKMLAARLARRGVTLSAGTLAAVLAEKTASASVPPGVAGATIKAASLVSAGQLIAASGISVKAVALMEGVLKAMFLSKIKITTAFVVGMGLLGISWGLYPTRAAAPAEANQEAAVQLPAEPPTASKDKNKVKKDGKEEKKIALPKGIPPAQVLVSLDREGKLVVKTGNIVYTRVRKAQSTEDPPFGPPVIVKGVVNQEMRAIARPDGPLEHPYDLKDVQVFDTKGKEIDKKDLPKLLKEETLAVATFGEEQPDPLHLRILKEGTLVFVLPPPPRHKMLLPDVKQAMIRKIGWMPFNIFYFQKIEPDLDPCEP